MAQVNFRIDDETKRRAESLFNSMGLTMSGAITIFIQQTLNRNEIPFWPKAQSVWPQEDWRLATGEIASRSARELTGTTRKMGNLHGTEIDVSALLPS